MKFKQLSVFIECSTGSTPKVKTIKQYIDIISQFGYNELYLGCTDAYKINNEPYFNYKRGGYTTKDFNEIDAYAKEKGIEVIASIQTLAHLHYLKKHDIYKHLFDNDNILLVGEPQVYCLIEKMLESIFQGLSSKRIHLGFDEAFGLGLGEYLKKNGYKEKKQILLEHLKKVAKIAEKFGYTCEIWDDMLITQSKNITNEEIINRIPHNVKVLAWEYNLSNKEEISNRLDKTLQCGKEIGYAGAAWKICGFAPSNNYSISRIIPQMQICNLKGVKQYMLTLWSDGGGMASIWSVLPTLFVAAEFVYGRFEEGKNIDKLKFKIITGVDFDDLYSLDFLNDPFMKNLTTLNSRSYWILYSDLLFGNYDLYLSEETGKAYQDLEKKYAEIDGGNFSHLFQMSKCLASVLAIKADLGLKLYKAYQNKDKSNLKNLRDNDLKELKSKFSVFINEFNDYWLKDNSAFGLDVLHLFFGGQATRYDYVSKRITDNIEQDIDIEEFEGDKLLPSIIPQVTEDTCFEMNYRNLISFCGI